jgi:signal transduction histidine kinase
MAVMSLLALMLFLRQTLAVERMRNAQADALQTQRDRLEVEVERRTADLTELARHLQSAREEEKSRLARELHDELGAVLTATKLDAARLKRAIGTMAPGVDARLVHLNESINRGIELKRRIIEELRPSSLSNLGLNAALEILVREFATRSQAKVSARLDAVELDDSAQITVFRLVQEALTNATRHGAAAQILVTLQASDRDVTSAGQGSVHVLVQDDGRGFDPSLRRGSKHGLMVLRYRIEAERGEMEVHSAPGDGTRVEAWLPLRAKVLADTGVA